MRCRPFFRSVSSPVKINVVALALLVATTCWAQEQEPPTNQDNPPAENSESQLSTVTIPAGTHLALALTQPIQSRHVRRGDDVYAQVISPVHSDTEVVIPPGTFVQGTVDKIQRHSGRGEIRLQSMSITFPDGYVTTIPGPMTLLTDEGYALKDPGSGQMVAAFAAPLAGVGIGAAIGHSITPSSSTITNTLPPGCTGPPPGCLSSSMTVPGNAGRNTVIGAGVGGAIGAVVSIALLTTSHHFYLDVGAPIQMQLQQPVTMQQGEVNKALRDFEEHPAPPPVVAARPVPPPIEPGIENQGTFFTPGTPGTPPTVIPGTPGPDGIPGPPTVIPGTPPTPGTPYPCP